MVIYLGQYTEGIPVKVAGKYDPQKLDLEFVDCKYLSDPNLEGTVEKGHDVVTFHGRLKSDLRRICGRCLKELDEKSDIPFQLFYETKGKTEIDTLDDLRECVLIEHPMSFICHPDCRGLCPYCGTDLNESSCRCTGPKEDKTPKTFSELNKIRRSDKEGKS